MFSLKPDFELSYQRMEAFWNHALLDRPVVQFRLQKPAEDRLPLPQAMPSTLPGTKMDAEYQAQLAFVELSNQHFWGDSLPVISPGINPNAFYQDLYPHHPGNGAEDASGPPLQPDWSSPALQRLDALFEALLSAGRSHFLVGIPSFYLGADVLAVFRGSLNLAADLLQAPDVVKTWLSQLDKDFFTLYDRYYERQQSIGQPSTTWVPLTAKGRFYLPANDFSALVSREMFNEFFLPLVQQECRFLDRSMYHLDGPGALQHLEALLEIPELDAIQYVPSPGKEAFIQNVNIYRRIQAAGKGVQVTCRLSELGEVMKELKPEGLYLVVSDVPDPDSAQVLLNRLEHWVLQHPHGENRSDR